MGCCGEKRAALRMQGMPAPPSQEYAPPQAASDRPVAPDGDSTAAAVEYLGDAPILLRGPESGRFYTFSPARRVQLVAGDDAPPLVGTPLFRVPQR